MTDNEIIKALECCISPVHCNGRQYYYVNAECSRELIENALDLINSQKAEIERLKEENKILSRYEDYIKAEAYKEFAYELMQIPDVKIYKHEIKNLLKEKLENTDEG